VPAPRLASLSLVVTALAPFVLAQGVKPQPKVIMPAFGTLVPASEDRWRIAQFVRTLGPAK